MDTDKIPRLSRLTAILLKLQSKARVSVKELASHFAVSTRTIYRDLAALEEAGVPLSIEEGKGYSLVEGYRLPPVMFTESEANALIIAKKMMDKTTDASLISALASAVDKIKSVLEHSNKEKVNFLADRVIVGKNWNSERRSSFLSDIQTALTNYRVLTIEYKKENDAQTSLRQVEPFAIYHNTLDKWVLIAWCRLRKDFRNFRLDRIVNLRQLEESFSPHEMTLEEYVEAQRIKHAKKPVT
ncbi:MAG: YafY family protein [Bacteroidota bacterium]